MFSSPAIGLRIYDLTFDTWPMKPLWKISPISAHEIKGVEGRDLAPVSIVHRRRRHLSVKSMAECDRKRQPDGGTRPTGLAGTRTRLLAISENGLFHAAIERAPLAAICPKKKREIMDQVLDERRRRPLPPLHMVRSCIAAIKALASISHPNNVL